MPKQEKLIFYVPQKPYLPTGTLRDQITYPKIIKQKDQNDQHIRQLLKLINLEDLVDREPEGFDTVLEWNDVLSGGEK